MQIAIFVGTRLFRLDNALLSNFMRHKLLKINF